VDVSGSVYNSLEESAADEQSNLFCFIPCSGWWDSSWQKRRGLVITENSGSTLTDYQVAINVTYDADMQSDFDDLRFTWLNQTSNSKVLCDAWLETKSDGA